MNTDIKDVKKIIFGVLSPEEIVNQAVCEIKNTKLSGPGSVYDFRMGSSLDTTLNCPTCDMNAKKCPGHFGYIELNEYVIHPLFYQNVLQYLRCFCVDCHRLLVTEDQLDLCGISKIRKCRFKKILDKLEKLDTCCHCNHPQPTFTYTATDNTIAMTYKEKIKNINNDDKKMLSKENKISVAITVDEIKNSFDEILDSDIKLCGLDPSRIHPRNLILSVFPVIPPSARPFAVTDGHICDDDLTNQLLEIIKANNALKKTEGEIPDPKKEAKRQKAYQSLKFRILTFMDNSKGKATHPTNNRAVKGIKERLTGKEGQLRSNLQGKRVEFSGRTVIGPDPNLPFGWMGVPRQIAEDLTIPERVTSFNMEALTQLVNAGRANFVITKNNDGEDTRLNLKYAMFRKGTELLYGDVILRGCRREMKYYTDLLDGDVIIRLGEDGERIKVNKRKLKDGDIVIKGVDKAHRIEITDGDEVLQNGDEIERNGELIIGIRYPTKKRIFLKIGDVVHRHLKDSDIVLLNRQPRKNKIDL